MSGLFDALSARFDPAAAPAIRPIAPARFEGGFEEIKEVERAAPAPAPQTAAQPVVPSPPRAEAMPALPVKSPASPASFHAAPTHEPTAPKTADTKTPDPPGPEESQTAQISPAPSPEFSSTPLETAEIRIETETTTSTLREDIITVIEESTHAPAPTVGLVETRTLSPRAADPAAPRAQAAAAPTPSPTIKIGRIEVRQHQPPHVPPRPPAPKPAPAAPQNVARSGGGPTASRLTSYLGWKR